MANENFIPTHSGTPQGGIISPLLANIALSVIEERYERWVNHQTKIQTRRKCDGIKAAEYARLSDRRAGRTVYFPIRYADDFVVLVSGSYEDALTEKQALEKYLRQTTGLELSPEKTKISALENGFHFLGHRVRYVWDCRYGWTPRIEIPKSKIADLRYRVKQLTGRSTVRWSLSQLLRKLNPILRGWANFYRFCTGAKGILASLDWYVNDRIWRWMRKKHPKARKSQIANQRQAGSLHPGRKVWREGSMEQYIMAYLKVMRFRRGWMKAPDFAMDSGEPDA